MDDIAGDDRPDVLRIARDAARGRTEARRVSEDSIIRLFGLLAPLDGQRARDGQTIRVRVEGGRRIVVGPEESGPIVAIPYYRRMSAVVVCDERPPRPPWTEPPSWMDRPFDVESAAAFIAEAVGRRWLDPGG